MKGYTISDFPPNINFTKQILNVIANSLKTIGHFNTIVLRGNAKKIVGESNLITIQSAIGNYEKIFKLDLKSNYNTILSTFRKQ